MPTKYKNKTAEQKKAAHEAKKRWAARNRDKVVQYKRKHYAENRDKFLRIERIRAWTKLYGITADDYDRMLAAQGGCCALCGTPSPGKRATYFAVDHCHITGAVRGLLCIKCNWRLGWFEERQAAVLNYLMASARTVAA